MRRSNLFLKNQRYWVLAAVALFLGTLYLLVPGDVHYWLTYWWLLPIAFLVALTVNTAGISGAALFVPFFILIFPLMAHLKLDPIDSVKLGLITESFGLSSSALAFLAFGLVDVSIAKVAVVRAIPFVLGGVAFVFLVPKSILYAIVAALLLMSVFLIQFEHRLKRRRLSELKAGHVDYAKEDGERVKLTSLDHKTYKYCRTRSGDRRRTLGYGIGGIFQGAAGFGIGELGIISMMLTDIPTRVAIGTSHLIVAGTAIIASLAHFVLAASEPNSIFPWNIVSMTVPAVIFGGQLAPHLAAKLPTKYLERFVSALFIVIALALVILALQA